MSEASEIIVGDTRSVLPTLPAESVQTCVTSPPYFGLRDYGVDGQMGKEDTPESYVAGMVAAFREVRRVPRPDGTLWLNLGDSYFGTGKGPTPPTGLHGQNGTPYPTKGVYSHPILKSKDLIGIPWRVALALQADGWYLRSDIIWAKPNVMPSSVRDRPTCSHEYLFLLAKSERYYYNADAIKEPADPKSAARYKHAFGGKKAEQVRATDNPTYCVGMREFKPMRNKRDVWTVTVSRFKGAHFATFPPALVEPCVLAGSRPGDLVLDPFSGAGTTGVVAKQHGRRYLGIELNADYAALASERIAGVSLSESA